MVRTGRGGGDGGERRNNVFGDGESGAGWVEEGGVQAQVDRSIVTGQWMRGILPLRAGNVYQILCGATYKVLSFGMWLKLATDSRLMLLLLSVLRRGKRKHTEIHSSFLKSQGHRIVT